MLNMGAFMMDPIGSVIEANKAQWNKIGDCGAAADTASGRAGLHLQPAREEIARKLIGNHVKVLKDCTNSAPLTQLELKRAPWSGAQHADEMLLASVHRLLGSPANFSVQLTATPDAAETRRTVFEYFRGRIQSDPSQKPGRGADMTPAAAAAWLAVLSEIAES